MSRRLQIPAALRFRCSCGEVITTSREHLGATARCFACGGGVPLTAEHLSADALRKPRFFCLCCGYRTLSEEPPGSHDVCAICGWEDDWVQSKDPEYRGGANGDSLREHQAAFLGSDTPDAQWFSHFSDGLAVDMTVDRDPSWKPLG